MRGFRTTSTIQAIAHSSEFISFLLLSSLRIISRDPIVKGTLGPFIELVLSEQW